MDNSNKENFVSQLQKLWSIESQLVDTLPKLIQKAENFGLKKTLALHFEETRQHQVAVEGICKQLGVEPVGKKDADLQKMLQESERKMSGLQGGDLDRVIIESALQVEQYEIETYEPVANIADGADYKGIACRLRLTLEEERQSDTKLRFLEKTLFSESAEIGQPQVQQEALRSY